MRVLLSYPFSGEDKEAVGKMLRVVHAALTEGNVTPVCVFFDVAADSAGRSTPRAAMDEAFGFIKSADALLVLQLSDRRSEGMLMEVGYALALQIPVIVAAHTSVKQSYLSTMASATFRWTTLPDLRDALIKLPFEETINASQASTRSTAR